MVKCSKVMQMKKYEGSKILSREDFRRQKGVYPETFVKMVEILRSAHERKKARGGRPNKLKIEDMLMMALEYWREYRTYFHIGLDYGLSESNTYQTIKWVENVLVKNGAFSLPGKKALLTKDTDYEVVLIDVTETPVERSKRGRKSITRERKSDIQ